MNTIYFAISLVVTALMCAHFVSFHRASMHWGRKLVGAPIEEDIFRAKVAEGMSEVEARMIAIGVVKNTLKVDTRAQSAITPKIYMFLPVIGFLLLIGVILSGWIILGWIVGVGSIFATAILMHLFDFLMPRADSDFLRNKFRKHLYASCEKYKSEGDKAGVEFCQNLLIKFDNLA